MKIEEFVEELAKGVQEELGEDYRTETKEVLKNNGIVLHGVLIGKNGAEVLPCLYTDELYQRFSAGRIGLDDAVKGFVQIYRDEDVPKSFDVRGFEKYENIYPKIRGKLINTEKNRELLQSIPHRDFLDLSLVYRVDMGESSAGALNLCIRDSHLKMWGIGEGELFEAVREYMEHTDDILFENMEDMIRRLLGEDIREVIQSTKPVYILSTKGHIYGAVYMLSEGIMERIADALEGDFTIIPSSIHELILLPDESGRICTEHLEAMIREVNRTELLPSEMLSCHAYHYSRESGEVKIAE